MCLHVHRFTVMLFAYILIADRRQVRFLFHNVEKWPYGKMWLKHLAQTIQGLRRCLKQYIVTSL